MTLARHSLESTVDTDAAVGHLQLSCKRSCQVKRGIYQAFDLQRDLSTTLCMPLACCVVCV